MPNLRLFLMPPPCPRPPHVQRKARSLTQKLPPHVVSPSRHKYLAPGLQVYTRMYTHTHTHTHSPSSDSRLLPLSPLTPTFQGPHAATKCESPAPAPSFGQ